MQLNNIRNLGLLRPAVLAAAPRQTISPAPAMRAHATKMLAAALNLESSAAYLANTPHFSSQLRLDIAAVNKATKAMNLRMMKEGHESITAAIDTLNMRGNLLDEAALMLVSIPEEVANAAMKAAADTVERLMYPKPKSKRGRPAKRIAQPAN